MFGVLKKTVSEFVEDRCMQMGAALAYYTVFSLPPLLVILIQLLGFWYSATGQEGEKAAQKQMQEQVTMVVGKEASDEVSGMIEHAGIQGGSPLQWLLSIAGILFGATGMVAALQDTLNVAWEVQPDPKSGGIKNFILKRVFSLGMILGIGFLLLVSTILTYMIGVFVGGGGQVVSTLVALLVVTALFAAMFKYLPDAVVAWKDAFVGAAVTAVLFTAGKFALSYYLANSNPGSQFSAGAGSLAILLVWVYYSSLILLFGAEFTQAWAERSGRHIEPEPGAVRVVTETKHVASDKA